MESKIIQIIPAPANMYVLYKDKNAPNGEFTAKIVCLGLTDKGDVYPMDTDDYGAIDIAVGREIVWKNAESRD